MARKSFWSVAGLLAALPLLVGLGIGVHTVIAFGQETPEAADQDATPNPQQGGTPVQTAKPVDNGTPLQSSGAQQSGPLQSSSPLQSAGPVQAVLPPLSYDVPPPPPPPNFAGQAPPDFVAGGCFSNDRLGTILGGAKPPSPEVLDMLVKDLKNPCAETPPPPPELVVASNTPVPTTTTIPPPLPPTIPPIVVYPPVVFNPTCQSQMSQTNC